MWRGILLGKLLISVAVSILVSYVCFAKGRSAETWWQAFQWNGLGIFFIVLTLAFMVSLVLLHYRKRPRGRKPD